MEKLGKKRAAARGWITRESKSLQELLNQSSVNVVELSTALEFFSKRLDALDEIQNEYEVLLDPAELDQNLDEAALFRKKSLVPLVLARRKLQELQKSDEDNASLGSATAKARLPKLELPKFQGEVTEWQSFWDQFTSHIDDTDMPDISKFSYLLSLLEGEAKVCVQGLSLTTVNYKTACDLLKERFGRPERIIFHHVQALLSGSVPVKYKGAKYVSSLWGMRDEFLTHIRSLEALGVSGKQCEIFLTPIILSRLPNEIRLEWARQGAGRESDLEWLLTFLQEEIQNIERSETFNDVLSRKPESLGMPEHRRSKHSGPRDYTGRESSASALHVAASEVDKQSCIFCNKRHKAENCFELLKLSGQDRADKIKFAGVCFKCLGKGHLAKGCLAKCTKCSGKHNALMCGIKLFTKNVTKSSARVAGSGTMQTDAVMVNEGENPNSNQSTDLAGVTLCNATPTTNPCTILPTARVLVVGANGTTYPAKLMFDSGSDRTYVSSKFVQRCKPRWISSHSISYSAFGGEKAHKRSQSNMFELQVLDRQHALRSVRALEVPVISEPLLRPTVPRNLLHKFSHLQLADDYANNFNVDIDILVGLEVYWSLITFTDAIQIDDVVALKSIFGYVLSGSWHATPTSSMSSPQLLCISRVSDFDVEKFWDLESVGISSKESDTLQSHTVLQEFDKNVQYSNGRYEVALPWKSEVARTDLVNNENLAVKRLNKLHAKLNQDVEFRSQYYQVFDEYEKTGIIEEVPTHEWHSKFPTFYMPHRPVVREGSTSTKIRPVFDASANSYNGVSLNDCLATGPSLNPDLVEVLLRFRRWPIAVTGDITKAFLQISVKREDRDVHRFLLKAEDGTGTDMRHMRFLRVPFGNTASPFLLNATIKHHLGKYPLTEAVQDLKDDMYVDNWLSGADSVDEAYTKFCEARTVLSHAGMPLTKWVSNRETITSKLNECFDYVHAAGASNVLGLHWCNFTDSFSFQGLEIPQFEFACTKRTMLSVIAKMFDPLGLISPYVMYGKILFQDVWRLGLSWDEELPPELQSKFKKWIESSECLKSWSVNRCYFPEIPWKNLPNVELHAFGDASEKGYGACTFIRTLLDDGSHKVSLVASKSRVAPIKTLTLPRLELLSALLCARLVTFVRNALKLSHDTSIFCWTDSKVALSWIQGNPHKWKMFVANRVTEIQCTTPPSCWHHCSGKVNPADLISRGVLANHLVTNSLWMNGPPWLSCSLSTKQVESTFTTKEEVRGYDVPVACVTVDSSSPVLEFTRWSHFTKALRSVAWVLRFVNNCKPNPCKGLGPLTGDELGNAKTKMIYCEQRQVYALEIKALQNNKSLPKGSPLRNLDPFLDVHGLLRVKGRLENAELSYENKHPIIVPRGHFAKLLVRFQHLFLKHGGVSTMLSTLRSNFWIIGVRRLAKSVIKECVKCQRHDSRPCNQASPPLPELRVKATPPFTVTGLDFAGPLFCADFPCKKFYILLFTCAVVRAIHLELTDSMSLSDCMSAIRRFIARRGLPSVIYSDNAKTFVASAQEIQKVYGHLAPQWKFIVPRSPWWGGWWERLIRSVKSAIRKSLGGNYVSRCELETVLHEVEASVNSRPLTYIEEKPDFGTPLTPSHFLIGRSTGFQTHVEPLLSPTVSKDLSDRETLREQMLDRFWRLWSDDYLRNLPPVVKGFKSQCNIKKGDVVLLREENVPRLRWPLGVIVDVFPDKEGVVRSVKVKTACGVVNRSVQKLHNLEIASSGTLTSDSENDEHVFQSDLTPQGVCDGGCTRSGRVVKPPLKLDL